MRKIIDFNEEKNKRIEFWRQIIDIIPNDLKEYDEAINELIKLGDYTTIKSGTKFKCEHCNNALFEVASDVKVVDSISDEMVKRYFSAIPPQINNNRTITHCVHCNRVFSFNY